MTTMMDIISGSKNATGIDISSHRGYFDIISSDEQMMNALDFVILRAGYVGYESLQCTTDMWFHEYYLVLEEFPEIRRGIYWYFSSIRTWEEQLEYYSNLIDEKDFDFIVGDFELTNNVVSISFAKNFESFMKALRDKYPNKKVFVYTRKDLYDTWITPYTTDMTSFPLWHAKYPFFEWVDHESAYFVDWWRDVFENFIYDNLGLPEERFEDEYELWQVGDRTYIGNKLAVANRDVDIDISRRDKQDFYDWIGLPERLGGAVEPPVIPPDACCVKITIDNNELELGLGESVDIKVEHLVGE